MTSLRTFQAEIEEVHVRELAKQRAHAIAVADDRAGIVPVVETKGKGKKETLDTGNDSAAARAGLLEVEEKILVCSWVPQNLAFD